MSDKRILSLQTGLYKHLKLTKVRAGIGALFFPELKLLRDRANYRVPLEQTTAFVFSIKHLYFVHYTERWKHTSPLKKSQTVNMKGLALRTHIIKAREGGHQETPGPEGRKSTLNGLPLQWVNLTITVNCRESIYSYHSTKSLRRHLESQFFKTFVCN